jgi:hypothetical protein
MLRKVPIVLSVLCGIVCLLLIALWARSYWSLDAFIGRLSRTTSIHGTSSNGQICLAMFSSPGVFNWTWKSTTHARLDAASRGLRQLQKEYQTILQSLEVQRSLALRHQSHDNAAFTARIDQFTDQIDQTNVEFQVISGRFTPVIATQLWGNSTQFETQLVTEAALGFPSVSIFWGFGAKRGINGWTVVCPHWCPVGLMGALAITVGIGRWWHFSLRTLLVTTTLVAAILGAIVYAVR